MGRNMTDTAVDLSGRESRAGLAPRRRIYWQMLEPGCLLGYYKGSTASVWIARHESRKRKIEDRRIGSVDDHKSADGVRVFDFEQAAREARDWHAAKVIEAAMQPIDDRPFNNLGPACNRV